MLELIRSDVVGVVAGVGFEKMTEGAGEQMLSGCVYRMRTGDVAQSGIVNQRPMAQGRIGEVLDDDRARPTAARGASPSGSNSALYQLFTETLALKDY